MGIPSASSNNNNVETESLNVETKIIIILSIILFIIGLLHLIVKFLLRPTQGGEGEEVVGSVVQSSSSSGQLLEQLFEQHDSGVDQSYIDENLPVFYYKSIIGIGLMKEEDYPFDCAVCLCEFDPIDRLRLLPHCSHAFHIHCIDTWLFSHSTCPLCRSSLLLSDNNTGAGAGGCSSSIVCVLEQSEAGVENSLREIISDSNPDHTLVIVDNEGVEKHENEEEGKKIVFVKLGKFVTSSSVDVGEGSRGQNNNTNNDDSSIIMGSRRCYSMGSFAYVLDETTSLQVPINKKQLIRKKKKKPNNLPALKPGWYRGAMSEYAQSDSRREFHVIEDSSCRRTFTNNVGVFENENGSEIERSKRRESSSRLSLSKIWARGRVGREMMSKKANDTYYDDQGSNKSSSELLEIELRDDDDRVETQSCYSVDSTATSTSTTANRRTLLWLMGKQQNKILHNKSNSLSSNNI